MANVGTWLTDLPESSSMLARREKEYKEDPSDPVRRRAQSTASSQGLGYAADREGLQKSPQQSKVLSDL